MELLPNSWRIGNVPSGSVGPAEGERKVYKPETVELWARPGRRIVSTWLVLSADRKIADR